MSEIPLLCPQCRTEYREGFSSCSDCHVPLVRRLESTTGDPLLPLARERSFEFVAELLDRLEKQNVPYVVEAGTAVEVLDNQSAVVTNPQPWEARVWVVPSGEERAAGILEQLKAEWQAERGQPTRRYLDVTGSGKPRL